MRPIPTISATCRRCDATFQAPLLLPADQLRVTELARGNQVMKAIQLVRQLSGIDIRDAKGVMMHVTRTKGFCQRCRASLPGSGQTECPKCGSLNFDW